VLVAAVAMAIVVYLGTVRRLGPQADWVEVIRSVALPILDPVLERAAGGVGSAYGIGSEELVGIQDAPPEQVEHRLWAAGCRRNPVSALKETPYGEQVGAWVYREGVEPEMQVDIILAAAPGDATAVYAHYEFSSALRWLWRNPSVLAQHYRGAVYNPERGADVVRDLCPDGWE
jgi:hypothetical protein